MKRTILSVVLGALIVSHFFCGGVCAAEYTLKEMTPQVQAALQGRKDRFETLEGLKAQGAIGENNRGYVEALSGDSQATAVVAQENADRAVVYQTIAEQNGIADQLSVIEKVFAEVQREKASAGYSIQLQNGEWVKK